jgi:hypothetical protein
VTANLLDVEPGPLVGGELLGMSVTCPFRPCPGDSPQDMAERADGQNASNSAEATP